MLIARDKHLDIDDDNQGAEHKVTHESQATNLAKLLLC